MKVQYTVSKGRLLIVFNRMVNRLIYRKNRLKLENLININIVYKLVAYFLNPIVQIEFNLIFNVAVTLK